jgi:hypothetical protein
MITSLITEGFSAFQRVMTAASKEENAIVESANKEVNPLKGISVLHCFDTMVVWSTDDTTYHNTTVYSGKRRV